MRPGLCVAGAVLAAVILPAPGAFGLTSHAGWPKIDGMLLMNKEDQSRPLDARPGFDPFGGQDELYRCDGLHYSQDCLQGNATCADEPSVDRRRRGSCERWVVKPTKHHNELLGGHGDDEIHAGPNGDVLWGDYREDSEQPTSQRDAITGGDGRDFIYASHGHNTIHAGGGRDYVKAHWGRGSIDCGGGKDTLFISHRNMPKYRITGCERITHKTLGY
jgi:Ca2+-binding RTX toxin-like protein